MLTSMENNIMDQLMKASETFRKHKMENRREKEGKAIEETSLKTKRR
jgi:hypothetical protein